MGYSELQFEAVSSSSGEIYSILMSRNGDRMTCTCSCPAGQMGTYCKHRNALLRSIHKNLSEADIDKLPEVQRMLCGSDVEAALAELDDFEKAKLEADKKLKAAKKKLGRVLND